MFSYFIRFIGTAKSCYATQAFLTTRLEAGFCILGITSLSLRASADFSTAAEQEGARWAPRILPPQQAKTGLAGDPGLPPRLG